METDWDRGYHAGYHKRASEETEPSSRSPTCSTADTADEVKKLEAMVDRAHDALNELLAEHLNICSEAAKIAKRGLWGE